MLPEKEANQKTQEDQLWSTDANACCEVNKVKPLDRIKPSFKVWFSGVMGFQTSFRAGLNVFEDQGGLLKFHPLIDISEEEFNSVYQSLNLPEHPLKLQGYGSVGCTHCTIKGEGRSGRWANEEKTECGLHPDFFKKK